MEHDSRRPDEAGYGAQPPTVLLQRMPQQAEVRASEDDWTGRTDAAERRKLQNRLHQRAYSKLCFSTSLLLLRSCVEFCPRFCWTHFIRNAVCV